MRPISDAFLLNVAEVSATLVGLFVVGVFFYAESGFRRLDDDVRRVVEPYVRAGTTIVLVLFAIPLGLSLALVALDPPWATGLFFVLSVLLVVTNVDTVRRIRRVASATRSMLFVVNEVVGTLAVVIIVTLPWVLGGLSPTREHLTWSILLSFAAGFLSVATLLLSVFDTPPQKMLVTAQPPDPRPVEPPASSVAAPAARPPARQRNRAAAPAKDAATKRQVGD